LSKKKKNKAEPRIDPTFERGQHNEILDIQTGKAGQKIKRVMDGSVLDYYHRNSVINNVQYHSGMRLYKIWRQAGIEKQITMRWDMLPRDTSGDFGSDNSALARRDLHLLAREMGYVLYKVVESVCCFDMLATDWARDEGRNKRVAPEILRISLDALDNSFRKLGDLRKIH